MRYGDLQMVWWKIKTLILIIAVLLLLLISNSVFAGARFVANYPCSDSGKECISSGTREIGGEQVYRACWEWAYTKTCNYPSKNDCGRFAHCYAVAERECLLRDSQGYCVNLRKEFSCKSWEVAAPTEKEMVRTGLVEKEGREQLICKGIPCIDGNCVDKSYMMDGEMMDSVSKLSAVSQMKGVRDMNFALFAGFSQSCSKKATNYTNCCSTSLKGWGSELGARCTKDEKELIGRRQKNLCVYVGKENKQTAGVTTVVKHHYCCFGSLLNKIIQVEGRKQLGKRFGSPSNPDCRGLTLAEIMRLDFNRMDFSEFYSEVVKRMKLPKTDDISLRVKSSLPQVKTYDNNLKPKENNLSGWNKRVIDKQD